MDVLLGSQSLSQPNCINTVSNGQHQAGEDSQLKDC